MATYTGTQLVLPVVEDAPVSPEPVLRRRSRREASQMTAEELLTFLLGPSHEAVCARLMGDHASFRALAVSHPLDWIEAGLSRAAVDRLEALIEFAKRYGETEWQEGLPFRSSRDIYAHFSERLATATREEFYGVLLDNKHRKIRDVLLSLGSLTASIVHPRDIYGRIMREAAAAVIFVHNHPSGDPTPSREDIEIPRRLREIGDLIGVRALDHIVIGKGRYVSFVDDGYW